MELLRGTGTKNGNHWSRRIIVRIEISATYYEYNQVSLIVGTVDGHRELKLGTFW